MKFESKNPAFKAFEKSYEKTQDVMTINGTINKTLILLGVLFVTCIISWGIVASNPSLMIPFIIGGAIASFILAMIIIFKAELSPILAPIYAILEGFSLGAFSAYFEAQFSGIALQAFVVTIGIFVGMLIMYRTGVIKVTDKFKKTVIGLTFGILIIYLISIIGNLIGYSVPYLHSNGLIGIGFSLFVVAIASLNLALDFNFIEEGVQREAPKFMEWYGSFGLLVTIVWLYIEVLKLLAKLRGSD